MSIRCAVFVHPYHGLCYGFLKHFDALHLHSKSLTNAIKHLRTIFNAEAYDPPFCTGADAIYSTLPTSALLSLVTYSCSNSNQPEITNTTRFHAIPDYPDAAKTCNNAICALPTP